MELAHSALNPVKGCLVYAGNLVHAGPDGRRSENFNLLDINTGFK
jgi:hypothetical protein